MCKKFTKRTFVLFILFLSIILCFIYYSNYSVPGKVTEVLSTAGANNSELKKVIDYYKNKQESKKLLAAYYLIEHMQDQYHYEGVGVNEYGRFFNAIDSLSEKDQSFSRVWDSLQGQYSLLKPGTASIVKDIKCLRADLLIQHIDAAFDAWNYPWAKQLSFNEFCEYILPYKLVNENPELWNKGIQKNYKWLLDSMRTSTSPVKACLFVNQKLRQSKWVNTSLKRFWDYKYSDLDKIFKKVQTKGCFYSTQYSAYILRSMGLPVAIDFTPYWANKSGGHEWDALILNGKPLPFIGTESDPGKTKVEAAFARKRAKIFRRTYSMQENNPLKFVKKESDVPILFRDTHIHDVTASYEPVSDVHIKLDREISTARIAYLCVFSGQDWKPVCWGQVDKNGYGYFKDMGRDIVYMPMYCEDEQMYPAATPFILRRSGKVDILSVHKVHHRPITLQSIGPNGDEIVKDKEYELFYWDPISEWTSLGKIKAESKVLKYENVPEDALLIIHSNHNSRIERIFTYESGHQKFW
jgi:hypothetical protein